MDKNKNIIYEKFRAPRGLVTLSLCDGVKVIKTVHSNLIVSGAYDLMALWAINDTSDSIAKIAVGEGGNVPGNPDIPVPPLENDTALVSQIAVKSIASATNPSNNESEFITSFGVTEGNGNLTEAGLLTSNNVLFARTTFKVISKTSGLTFIVRWKITF